MESYPQNYLQWEQTFSDCYCKLNLPNDQTSKSFINSLNSNPNIFIPKAIFPNIFDIKENVPAIIDSVEMRNSSLLYSPNQYNFMLESLKKMTELNRPSLHIFSLIQKESLTTWGHFYFKAFLQQSMEKRTNFKLVSRYKQVNAEKNSQALENLLRDGFSQFRDVQDFAFVDGNLEDLFFSISLLKFCNDIIKRSEKTLEKLLLFFRSTSLYKFFIRIFEKLKSGGFPQLKSLRLALGGG